MPNRRDVLIGTGAFALSSPLGAAETAAPERRVITKAIPKTGEEIPIIGLGTSRTFNIDSRDELLPQLGEVMDLFFDGGGTLIDSSPMYGKSEEITGILMKRVKNGYERLFAATKVWTDGEQAGTNQMHTSMERMGVEVMDLMQIHNLRDWQTHLKTLQAWKAEGKIRYIGITTSNGRFHNELSEIMRTEDLDFVQFSYSIDERTTESNLLPMAADQGIATLINRPFRRGETFKAVKDKPLPDWASEIEVTSWGQYFLKFVASHPAATNIIPATSKPHHMRDNMGANVGRMPNDAMRAEMVTYFESL